MTISTRSSLVLDIIFLKLNKGKEEKKKVNLQ